MQNNNQDSSDAACPHCHEESIREAKVTTAEPGWEANPPSPDEFGLARVCYICLCQWTPAGEFVRQGQSCNVDDPQERTR